MKKRCERCGQILKLGKRFCSYKCVYPSFEERFWSKVKKTKTCWLWQNCINEAGYGKFNLGRKNGKIDRAHRVSYTLLVGPIPESMHVLHKCDIPACVNPDHLYIGTDKENGRDRAERKRSAFNEKNHLTKFKNELILKIRKEVKPGTKVTKELVKKYGVSQRHIRDIINYKTRRNV